MVQFSLLEVQGNTIQGNITDFLNGTGSITVSNSSSAPTISLTCDDWTKVESIVINTSTFPHCVAYSTGGDTLWIEVTTSGDGLTTTIPLTDAVKPTLYKIDMTLGWASGSGTFSNLTASIIHTEPGIIINDARISGMYVGDTEVSKVYLGEDLIYEVTSHPTFELPAQSIIIPAGTLVNAYNMDTQSWGDINTSSDYTIMAEWSLYAGYTYQISSESRGFIQSGYGNSVQEVLSNAWPRGNCSLIIKSESQNITEVIWDW